ncbi:alginate export family protein [Sphingomonas sp. UNC305MFCol5.2]|uniref:alginate export family protein n=1 Tax=Sphingomonas sp. UNC305MFCol5.2 TaxID=1449076 RepID=UPI00041A2681|nr:alginate export family protein [Sphingomonas sp. UNC305MFCol5.2]
MTSTFLSPLLRGALTGFCAVAALPAFGQIAGEKDGGVQFSIDATTRARVEAIGGQFRPNVAADDVFVSFRTTVAAKAELGAVAIGGEIVDARGYGQRDGSSVRTSEVNALEPIQAYVAYRASDAFARGATATITAGRWSLDIGSSRLVGRTDFPNAVQSYLGGLVEWRSKGKDRIVAFWAKPFSALPDDVAGIEDNAIELDRAGGNLTFFGASATLAKAFRNVGVEAYGYRLAEDDRVMRLTRNRHLVTAGVRLRRAPAKGQFDFEGEAAYQWGTARATTAVSDVRNLDVRAGFAHVEAGWTAARGWTPRVSAMFDYASGDGRDAGTWGRFDTLFGARRSDFGPVALYGPVGRANLLSPGLRLEAKPSKRLDFMTSLRGLWLARATDSFASTGVRDRNGASGRYAGTQFEARARRWLVPERLRLEVGGAYLAKGRFLENATNAPDTGDTRYVYMDLAASF